MTKLGVNLGVGSGFQSGPDRNWDDVYADGFVATSGTTYSRMAGKNPQVNLTRSLTEILKLQPISYKENSQNIGSRITTEREKDVKLGFDASKLLKIIPEAVKKYDWVTLKEGTDKVKMDIQNLTGIMYNQLIPVL